MRLCLRRLPRKKKKRTSLNSKEDIRTTKKWCYGNQGLLLLSQKLLADELDELSYVSHDEMR